jgi:hypothetical protein
MMARLIQGDNEKIPFEDFCGQPPVSTEVFNTLLFRLQMNGGWPIDQPRIDRFSKHQTVAYVAYHFGCGNAENLFTTASLD